MQKITRTTSNNADFIALVAELDADLAIRDGEDHAFYSQFNKINSIGHVIVLYDQDIPVACGALKKYDSDTAEIKRMYTTINNRGKGLASVILAELEKWALELSFKKCILETGIKQPEAIALYHKNNYNLIENYGQYAGIKESKCFEKVLQ